MTTDKNSIIREIASAFNLSDETAQTALVLLEARARTLDFTFSEYMNRYHPEGIAEKDEELPEQFKGYVQFLSGDASTVLRAGKGADFSTFVHECAHVFRRQLTGELREQAEKAFGITDGTWSEEKEELFAKGLERWVKRRHGRDRTRADVYNKGVSFVDTVYRGMEHIVEIDKRMENVYEKLFEDKTYIFNQKEYETTLSQIAEGKLPEKSHVFLGMTPRIYEELGFERLPMAMTRMHLYSTLRNGGSFNNVNYHDLGEDILRQIPEQLKKPLLIVQSANDETEIISVIGLTDKNGKTIIVPVAQNQKGNFNGAEIDINLVKTVFGKDKFNDWLKEAINDNRLLYIDKKKTEPALNGKLTQHFSEPFRSASQTIKPVLLQNVFGFTNNLTRYIEAVKEKYPERFKEQKNILYHSRQLFFDLDEKPSLPVIPHPNTPDNFTANYRLTAGSFKNDPIEAARFLLREMTKEDRAASLSQMQNAGCIDKESYHRYLFSLLNQNEEIKKREEIEPEEETQEQEDGESPEARLEKRIGKERAREIIAELQKEEYSVESIDKRFFAYRPFGAWTSFSTRLSEKQREEYNNTALSILEKGNGETAEDKEILRRYSGFGGVTVSGERGVLYDYYTSPPVADLTWRLLEKSGGIKDGARILEPSCGTGVFFEYAPKDKTFSFTGVELDKRTAQIASIIHDDKNAEIKNMSFEAFNFSKEKGNFDYIIGNAPFGERSADLCSLDMPDEKSLDNYFVTRSIDNLKENGTMALITAPGVLSNKSNEDFRLSLNKKAQFAGAVKLPDRSFRHSHTQVTPDILLFRKYPDDIQKRLSDLDDGTFKTTAFYDDVFVSGAYFENNSRHIAGTVSEGTGQWGKDEVKGDIDHNSVDVIVNSFTPAVPFPEDVFQKAREEYVLNESLKEVSYNALNTEELTALENKSLRSGTVKIEDGKVFILTDNRWKTASSNITLAEKLEKVFDISKSVKAVREAMKNEQSVETIKSLQNVCLTHITDFNKKYDCLPQDDKDIKRFTKENPAVQGVYEAFLNTEDPLLTQTNVYRKNIEIVDGHNKAVSALLTMREKLKDATEENIREFFPDKAEELFFEMKKHNDVFITPHDVFQLREDFISGDAWKKIDELKEAAESESRDWKKELLLRGAEEIEKAVGWTPIEDADFSPRSSWIPEETIREWASGEDALGKQNLSGLSKNEEGKWGLNGKYGWQEHSDPLVYYLNGQKQRSRYYDTDSFNKEHDELFRSFVSNHEGYRTLLESEYNRKFKTYITAPVKTYPVEISGWRNRNEKGEGKTVQPHQWQSVHHLYRNGCGISALGTGFGKTVTAIALMSLLRQEAKAKRIFLQVPNNKVKDWVEEIRDVMPALKISYIDPEEKGYSDRGKRYAKYQAMAGSGADIIIMPESSASEIQMSTENDTIITRKVASMYRQEKALGSARQRELASLKGERKAASGKTNVTVCFEDFGCDAVFVDEAHRYKNLFTSSLSRETGMNDGRQSAKAMSLYKKSEYIRERNNGKNVFLLTATPLTNSPLEYYNMMQYIAPQELSRTGVSTIDGFIREFADIETGWLYDWGTGQAKQGNILKGFKNLQTLQNLFFSYTDLQNNPDAIGLDKPKAENSPHIIPPDEKQVEAVRAISAELDMYKSLDKKERQEQFPGQNFLTFYSQMRTASLDLELYDPVKYKGWKSAKLQTLAGNAYSNNNNTKGGQVVFCDRVFSSNADFNMHDKIKDYLIEQGFKEKEIVVVNGFTKSGSAKSNQAVEKEVSKAVADYNNGKYKVIIGSTSCIGEGLNLQKNSSSVHHLDIPYRPSDFIQRNGRVDRQGNSQDKVTLNSYLATGTIDNYSVNLVQRKADWIDQLLRTKSEVFTNPNDENSVDADELLLALTEEWGDKDAVNERKAEIERQKQEKIKEAQEEKAKTLLKNLSLARSAVLPLKEGTGEYKKRVTQISSIEAALKTNPCFTHHDLLDSKEPFLYNADSNMVIRKDDVFITAYGKYVVEGFNFKKQIINCGELLTEDEIKEKKSLARIYGTTDDNLFTKDFKLTALNKNNKGYLRGEVLYRLEKTSEEDREIVKNAGSKEFYKMPEDIKEKYYGIHCALNASSYDSDAPYVFFTAEDGTLNIQKAYYNYLNKKLLNPFSEEGKKAIHSALEKGVNYSGYGRDDVIEVIRETVPELKPAVENAVIKTEIEIEKKKQALLEKIDEETKIEKARKGFKR